MKSSKGENNAVPAAPSDPHEAFRRVVYAYGVERMAAELGMKRGTLYNKCD